MVICMQCLHCNVKVMFYLKINTANNQLLWYLCFATCFTFYTANVQCLKITLFCQILCFSNFCFMRIPLDQLIIPFCLVCDFGLFRYGYLKCSILNKVTVGASYCDHSQLLFLMKIKPTLKYSRTVFFNLFIIAEPKMTKINFAEPKSPSKKTLRNPNFSKVTNRN